MSKLFKEIAEQTIHSCYVGKFEERKLAIDTEERNLFYSDKEHDIVFILDVDNRIHKIHTIEEFNSAKGYIESYYYVKLQKQIGDQLRSELDELLSEKYGFESKSAKSAKIKAKRNKMDQLAGLDLDNAVNWGI